MSKFVAKFRKERDYEGDYEYSQRKKRSSKHDPAKKLNNYNYDQLLQDYDNEYEFPVRKKAKKVY